MMLEAIQNRRSIRWYKDTPVTDDQIEEVLKAGFCAPSAHGSAPWHVVVVKDQDAKDKIGAIHKWTKIVVKAPVAIVVCIDRSDFDHFWIDDGSAFMENMLIQATSMGLSTCWIGLHGVHAEGNDAEAVVRETLGLPDHLGAVAMTPLGYAARHPGPHEPKIPNDRIRVI